MMAQVALRSGEIARVDGRGIFGGILVGQMDSRPITWNFSGRWRWDGVDHPLDIMASADNLPRRVIARSWRDDDGKR